MKIANKISLSFLAAALIILSAAGITVYIVAKNNLQKSIYNNLSVAAASRTNHIETYLEMLKISVGQLSKSVVLEDFLKIKDKEDSRYNEAFQQAMRRLKRTKEVNPSIFEFMLLDAAGKVAASSSENSIGADKSTDAYFLGGQKKTFIRDVYYSEILKEVLMAVSAPFLDSDTGKLLGVIVARVRLNDLNNIVTNRTGLGRTGDIYIVNKYGFMITPSRFIKDAVLKQKVDTENVRRAQLQKGIERTFSEEEEAKETAEEEAKETANVFPDYRGVQVLGTHIFIPRMQWAVLVEIDAKEAFAPLAELRLLFFLILFIAVSTAWLSGIFIARFISKPIHKLHKGTEIIGGGNLDYKVGTAVKDEIGQLSRAFDTMTENLKNTTTSIESLNKEAIEHKQTETHLQETNDKIISLANQISDVMKTICKNISDGEPLRFKNPDLVRCQEVKNCTKTDCPAYNIAEPTRCWKIAGTFCKGEVQGVFAQKLKDCRNCEVYLRARRDPICNLGESFNEMMFILEDRQHNLENALKDTKQAKEQAEAANEAKSVLLDNLEAIFEASPVGMVLLNEKAEVIKINGVIEKLVGKYRLGDQPGNLFGCIHSLENPKGCGHSLFCPKCPIRNAIKTTLEDGRSARCAEVLSTLLIDDKKTDVWLEVDAEPVVLDGKKCVIVAIDNITERKKSEKEMKEAVEMKTRFISTASHELRTPLTSIKEGINLVYSEITGSLNNDQKEFLGIAKRNVDRLARLINDVLDFQKMTAGKMAFNIESASINETVRFVEETMRPLTKEKGLDFIIELDDAIPFVDFDKDKIIQVLTNLVSNAVKFTETGSIKITTSRGDNNVIIAVKDSGGGIKQEDMHKLFVEFEQLATKDSDRKVGGTGLGLAISKKIVESHGGRIWVESEYGKGTTFYFELPMEAIPCQIKS